MLSAICFRRLNQGLLSCASASWALRRRRGSFLLLGYELGHVLLEHWQWHRTDREDSVVEPPLVELHS
jgi:hypothetical protein